MLSNKTISDLPLFKRYPALASSLPYINLGNYPTPIYQVKNINAVELYIKDEGICGKRLENGTQLSGGNKGRKLEFALADAIKQNCSTVMTFSPVGSNHAATTTMYAALLGLKSICLLSHQPTSNIVRRNLLLQKYYDAELYFYKTRKLRSQAAIKHFVEHHAQQGEFPYVIPTGASYPLGTVGFVNAAFELYEQIQAGIVPEPDFIYVATGSHGTFAGLVLGCKVVGLKTKVIGVAIEPNNNNLQLKSTLSLVRTTNKYLHENDNSFPLFDWCEDDITINMDFTGQGYGISTPETQEAISFLKNNLNITLDHVYSGKAFAAVLNHIKNGFFDGKKILFLEYVFWY